MVPVARRLIISPPRPGAAGGAAPRATPRGRARRPRRAVEAAARTSAEIARSSTRGSEILISNMERKAEPSWAVEAPAALLRCWLECVKADKSACALHRSLTNVLCAPLLGQ